MMNATNLIYSMASAARILAKDLGNIFKRVENIKFVKSIVQVTYKTIHGRCSTFLSFTSFKKNFVDRRQEDSQELEVKHIEKNHKYKVINSKKNSSYTCRAYTDGVECECEDYRNQIMFFKKGCCKHGYAVLSHLGFKNLGDYVEHHRWCGD
jgi:hypothetical protein